MKIYTYLIGLFFLMGLSLLPLTTHAQYDEFLKPQDPELTLQYKKNKVQFIQTLKSSEEQADTFNSIAALDTFGRRIFVKTEKMVIAYRYDNDGKVTHRKDTVFKDGKPFVSELNAKYDAYGKLKVYKTENYLSDFKYKPESRELFEQIMQNNGTTYRRYYKYDDKHRLFYTVYADGSGKPIQEHKYLYTFYNTIETETITDYKPNYAKKITTINYAYNKNNLLTSKNTTIVDNVGGEEAEKNGFFYIPNTNSHYVTFDYNDKNQLIKEISSVPETSQLDFTILREYDKNGLLTTEKYYNYQKINTQTLTYKYIKYGEVKIPQSVNSQTNPKKKKK